MANGYFLVGPTAVGKTGLIHRLADTYSLPVLSTDSMLVYRGMDIGTAKPPPEERLQYGYLGIDLVDPNEPFSTGTYLDALRSQLGDTPQVLAAGGTGLYVSALLEGLNEAPPTPPAIRSEVEQLFAEGGLPALHKKLRALDPDWFADFPDPLNPRRVSRAIEILLQDGKRPTRWGKAPATRVVGLQMERATLHARITDRVARMFADGLLEEIEGLIKNFPEWSVTASRAIGYEEGRKVVEGQWTESEAMERIAARTRQLAKRQMTWFRNRLNVEWVEVDGTENDAAAAERIREIWESDGPAGLAL